MGCYAAKYILKVFASVSSCMHASLDVNIPELCNELFAKIYINVIMMYLIYFFKESFVVFEAVSSIFANKYLILLKLRKAPNLEYALLESVTVK